MIPTDALATSVARTSAGHFLLFAALVHVARGSKTNSRKSVLFIVADDFRTDMNSYFQGTHPSPQTRPVFHTPNLDALASRSLLFERAYVQFSLCAPSRHSFLTGRRPDTTKTYDFEVYWRNVAGNFTTLPQYFRENGYWTLGFGKVFQHGPKSSNNDDPISWSSPAYRTQLDQGYYRKRTTSALEAIPLDELKEKPLPDEVVANKSIEALRQLAPKSLSGEQPFFLAVGFVKPHLPFQYPPEYVQYYKPEDMPLPKNKYQAMYSPKISRKPTFSEWLVPELRRQPAFNETYPDSTIRAARAGYYRSASFMDAMVGKVLDELSALGLDKSTIVSFIGDHGFHLGEQSLWKKETAFEIALRTPMLIRMPGITDRGGRTSSLVEFVDLFPTLVDLAGLPPVPKCPKSSFHINLCTEGVSMIPLFCENDVPFKNAAFSQQIRGKFMGYTVKSDKYRYTEWVRKGPVWSDLTARELYDHTIDPDETWNRVALSEYSTILRNLSRVLRAGWTVSVEQPHKIAEQVRARGCLRTSKYIPSHQVSTAGPNDVALASNETSLRISRGSHSAEPIAAWNDFSVRNIHLKCSVLFITLTVIWLAYRRMTYFVKRRT